MITIFTDGSSRGNPGPGGWGAIISTEHTVKELGGREDMTTNNRMELSAAIYALKAIPEAKKVTLYTDSSYMINGITKWVFGWQRNSWLTATKQKVLNDDLWKQLIEVSRGKEIAWTYVAGHSGIPANERCDVIATAFADKDEIELYEGVKAAYTIDVTNLSGNLIGEKKKSTRKGKAYSYLSMVDGVIETHTTWEACEKRVKGVKAAKFKKALSAQEEQSIISEWKKGM